MSSASSRTTPWLAESLLNPRLPPANLEAEQSVLGALLANNKAYARVEEFLRAEHFADPVHGRIFKAIEGRIHRGELADAITLRAEFQNSGELEEVGGPAYLANLLAAMVGIVNAGEYGRVIYDCWLRRKLLELGQALTEQAYGIDTSLLDGEGILDEGMRALYRLSAESRSRSPIVSLEKAGSAAIERARRAALRGDNLVGVPTFFEELDQKLGGLEPGAVYVVAGRPGMGKAQPLTAQVLRADGAWTSMGNLKIGDALASIDGGKSLVSGIFPQGEQQVFRVTLSDGRHTEVCGDHLWRVHYRAWREPRVLSTREVAAMLGRRRYSGRLSIDLVSGHFGTAEVPLDGYVLGVLLGDGDLTGPTPKLTSADPAIPAMVQARLGGTVEVRQRDELTYSLVSRGVAGRLVEDGCRLEYRRRFESLAVGGDEYRSYWPRTIYPVHQALASLGLKGVGSEGKFIPEVYFRAPREERLDLLRGLLDTDGWVERHGSVRFSSCSKQLAVDVQRLVRSLGGLCTVREKRPVCVVAGERRDAKTAYVCGIRHPGADTFFGLHRKSILAKRGRNASVRLTIGSVEPMGSAPVQCISVTHSSRLYITDDYTVTHNTAFALQVALRNAQRRSLSAIARKTDPGIDEIGARVGYISLEMGADQLATRALSLTSGVDFNTIRRGYFLTKRKQHEADAVIGAQRHIADLPFLIQDTPALTADAIERQAVEMSRRMGSLDLLIIDHLTIMGADPTMARQGPTAITTANSGAVKRIAKRLGIPVILLAQLSRKVEEREDKRPMLSDLRESGAIEQDAENVIFLYRPEYYLRDSMPERKDGESSERYAARCEEHEQRKRDAAGKAELIVAKNRNGPTGTVEVGWDGERARYADDLAAISAAPPESYWLQTTDRLPRARAAADIEI